VDKKVVFAVAGAGKTSLIISNLSHDARALLVTYTRANEANLRRKVIRKFGCIPPNVRIYSYFNFLHSFCYKPFCAVKMRTKGINWNTPPVNTLMLKRSKRSFYVDSNGRLYSNRIAKFLEQANLLEEINLRIEKYFDFLFIDEVQDFAGHDFNFLTSLCTANIRLLLVGDFFQHTYDTSRDGSVNRTLHNDFGSYASRFERLGLLVDTNTLNKSHRCSPDICEFISENLEIPLSSHRTDRTSVEFLQDEGSIEEKFFCQETVKLFYQSHDKYPCFSQNWGASKGEDDYNDICVILHPGSYELLIRNELKKLNPQTKNKLYVACSRARGSLFLIPEKLVMKYRR
jgi:DNA helicase-2/ATP-dependent DNA helicase PcrA